MVPTEANRYDETLALAYAAGWTDGLPIVPPTAERVRAFVDASGRSALEVVGEIPPRGGRATVEKLAANAVMAGCLPEYFPVVIAAIEALLLPRFNLASVQCSTHIATPLVVVNGPIAEQLDMNAGGNCFGQGNRANATIGRAVKLALTNLGGALPGDEDRATFGHPGKYTYCIAENEEANPWGALHVERGFNADQSTVTVMGGEPPHNINDHTGATAEEILTIIAGAMAVTGANNAYTGGETLLALGPEHAATMAADGFTKADIRDWLHHHARVPLERYTGATMLERFGQIPDGPVPMVATPEDLAIIVLGGPGKHSSWVPTFGGATRSVTREIG